MDGLRFETPYALVLLLLVPALALFYWRSRRNAAAVALGAVAPAEAAPRTWRIRLQPLLPALRILSVVLLVVALARPQSGHAEAHSTGEGIDIVLGFDVSSSMSEPFTRNRSRLEVATDVLQQFVRNRTRDRVGLVAFQASSLTLSPLTTDYEAVAQSVKNAGTLRLKDGTAIGTAIGESVNLLRTSSARSRIIILLTDGENNVHQVEPLEAARIAEKLGIHVYTVGVVSQTIGGQTSTVNVDEASLQQIADVTGGTYSRAEDATALAQIYSNIDQLERSRFEGNVIRRYDDFAPWVLAAAAVLLALELTMRHSLLRRPA